MAVSNDEDGYVTRSVIGDERSDAFPGMHHDQDAREIQKAHFCGQLQIGGGDEWKSDDWDH